MKRARVLVSLDVLVEVFKGGAPRVYEVVNHALPTDARCVDVAYISSERMIALDLESDAFDEMPMHAKHPPILSSPDCRMRQLSAEDAEASLEAEDEVGR